MSNKRMLLGRAAAGEKHDVSRWCQNCSASRIFYRRNGKLFCDECDASVAEVAAPIAPAAVSETELLAEAIVDIAIAAGITKGELPMTGPEVLTLAKEIEHFLAKPSAEGDGWIAPKTMPGECELVQILLTDNRVTAGHYTETPKLGVEWWADGGLLETQDIQAWKPMSPPPPQRLPAPPSGQGEKR